jgi:DNA-binding NarL/FixJ family response regulator
MAGQPVDPTPDARQTAAANRDRTIRILVVDDSHLFRTGLASLLSTQPGIEVVGLAENGKEAAQRALELRPDVITIDLQMPVQGGLSATREIMDALPTTRVVLLTGLLTDDWLHDSAATGAFACLSKDTTIQEMVKVIRTAAESSWSGAPVSRSRLNLRGPRGARLTRRELEILLLLAKGYGPAGIASQLGLRPRTVSGYVSVIYSKLGTQSRSGAILYAARAGLIDDATGDAPLKTG